MESEKQKRIFAKNLNYYISRSGKLQKEVAKDIGISQTTFNTWCKGKIMPSVSKVQQIADYFKIGKSFLLDEFPDDKTAPFYEKRLPKEIIEAYDTDSRRMMDYAKKLLELRDIEKENLNK